MPRAVYRSRARGDPMRRARPRGVWYDAGSRLAADGNGVLRVTSGEVAEPQHAHPHGESIQHKAIGERPARAGLGLHRELRHGLIALAAIVGPATLSTSTQAAVRFYSVTPCRLVDTREASQGPALAPGESRALALAGRCGTPPTATTFAANLTVTGSTAQGHLTTYAAGLPAPFASTINFQAAQTRANNATHLRGHGGQLRGARWHLLRNRPSHRRHQRLLRRSRQQSAPVPVGGRRPPGHAPCHPHTRGRGDRRRQAGTAAVDLVEFGVRARRGCVVLRQHCDCNGDVRRARRLHLAPHGQRLSARLVGRCPRDGSRRRGRLPVLVAGSLGANRCRREPGGNPGPVGLDRRPGETARLGIPDTPPASRLCAEHLHRDLLARQLHALPHAEAVLHERPLCARPTTATCGVRSAQDPGGVRSRCEPSQPVPSLSSGAHAKRLGQLPAATRGDHAEPGHGRVPRHAPQHAHPTQRELRTGDSPALLRGCRPPRR